MAGENHVNVSLWAGFILKLVWIALYLIILWIVSLFYGYGKKGRSSYQVSPDNWDVSLIGLGDIAMRFITCMTDVFRYAEDMRAMTAGKDNKGNAMTAALAEETAQAKSPAEANKEIDPVRAGRFTEPAR